MDESKIRKILVIEDEAPMREAIGDTLTENHFVLLTADNGKDGLEIALREHPDLILLDIFMPKMDGLSLLETLRNDAWGHDVPVIILTILILKQIKQYKVFWSRS